MWADSVRSTEDIGYGPASIETLINDIDEEIARYREEYQTANVGTD